jgi:hypothetical protein
MLVRFRDVAATFLALSLAAASPLAAQGYFASDNLAYRGTVSCYLSYTAAFNHTSPDCGVGDTEQRDLAMYFVDGNAAFSAAAPNQAIFLTNNYSNTGNNPSNQTRGYVQMYDNDGTSVTSMDMQWDDSQTMFTLAATGANAVLGCSPPQDCAALWNLYGAIDGGIFLNWSVNAIFTGFTQATFNDATSVFESASEPMTVTGHVSGLFWDVVNQRYYNLDAELNADSWAVANGYATNTRVGAAVTATPEPATLALLATGFIAVAAFARRRRREGSFIAAA